MLNSAEIIKLSGIQFGTSGARGLIELFTKDVCAAFSHAFIQCMRNEFNFKQIAIGIDNRPSSPAMAQACAEAIQQAGLEAIYYGVLPTPALAYVSIQDNIPCIMVTGSHIPYDRNGLKFYRPDGEISKADENAILNINVNFESANKLPTLTINKKASIQYIKRYSSLFDSKMLAGKRIGIYEHSSAGRDLYPSIFKAFGADVITIGRSNDFVPIDTEAVSENDRQKAKLWSKKYNLDFIFSTDGDGDRPLVADENGEWLRGDILGLLAAKALNIEALAVPISCNSLIANCDNFKQVILTKIGSPYVIEQLLLLKNNYSQVAGFEANGGFILGSDIILNNKNLASLPTRDALLPAIMLLSMAKNKRISSLVSELPKRFTSSDRITNFPIKNSISILNSARSNPSEFIKKLGLINSTIINIDNTDGFRITFENSDILHFRPSGNAPELRCYAESESEHRANTIVRTALTAILSL